MIDRISGKLVQKLPTYCVVETGRLGLGVFISVNTSQELGEVGEAVSLLTHLHVREDALQLYGFSGEPEREAFRQLISVGGIGPRLALTILSGLTVPELTEAIAMGNYQVLTRVPGVGKKTAQRMVLELKEKVALPEGAAGGSPASLPGGAAPDKLKEAVAALVTLGYRSPDARRAVEAVMRKNGDSLNVEELIKLALKEV